VLLQTFNTGSLHAGNTACHVDHLVDTTGVHRWQYPGLSRWGGTHNQLSFIYLLGMMSIFWATSNQINWNGKVGF